MRLSAHSIGRITLPNVIALLLLVLIFPGHGFAQATNIYVSQNGGGFSGGSVCNGQTTISAATFNASSSWGTGSAQIGPGTTVYLCGTFTAAAGGNLLTAQGSGASGKPITIEFDSGAVLAAPYSNSSGGLLNIGGLSYIVVDGNNGTACGMSNGPTQAVVSCNGQIENTTNGDALANQQASMGLNALNCSNCEIRNLYIHDIYDKTSWTASYGNTQNPCIQVSGPGNWVHNNQLVNCGEGIDETHWNANDTIKIENNYFSNDGWAVGSAGGATTLTSFTFDGNYDTNPGNWATAGDVTHINGIHWFDLSGGGIAAIYVYNDVWTGNWDGSTFYPSQNPGGCCMTDVLFQDEAYITNIYRFNNLTLFQGDNQTNPGDGLINLSGSGTTTFLNVNNTDIGVPGTNPCEGGGYGGVSPVQLENNIIEGCGQLLSYVPSSGSLVAVLSNLYANASSGNQLWQYNPIGESSFSSWQSACSCDASPSAFQSSNLANLSSSTGAISSGFAGIAQGVNLTSLATGPLAALAYDITGAPRPSSGSWDIGAFAYGSSSSSSQPAPPSGLTATVQ